MCTAYVPGSAVLIMDSLALFTALNQATILQLAKLYSRVIPPSQSFLNIETLAVQQQTGSSDCGVFAIANAVDICMGTNPENVRYDQGKIRAHLEDCFIKKSLCPFPRCSTAEPLPRPTRTVHKIRLYCVCKMPEEYDEKMISCDTCRKWFHVSCVLSKVQLPDFWECNGCQKTEV